MSLTSIRRRIERLEKMDEKSKEQPKLSMHEAVEKMTKLAQSGLNIEQILKELQKE